MAKAAPLFWYIKKEIKMKYCCEFNGEFPMLRFFDEIIVKLFPKDDNAVGSIPNFFDKHSNATIIIQINDSKYFVESGNTIVQRISAQLPNKNYKFKFNNPFNEYTLQLVEKAKEQNIPFFFDMLVSDWDVLQYVSSLGVSDMYITSQLGFELTTITPFLHSKGIDIRVYPNVAQAEAPEVDSITKFYIRPDDLDTYTDYVDTYEFLVNEDNKLLQLYYIIYAMDCTWKSDLSNIIIGLDARIDNRGLFNTFGAKRLLCGKRCAKGKQCNYCHNLVQVANDITEEGFQLIYKKSENAIKPYNRISDEEKERLKQLVMDKIKEAES
jgi:hypothetical protein